MSAHIIDGKALAEQLRQTMSEEVSQLKSKGIAPHVTVIVVGDDPASHSYIRGKEKAADKTGIGSEVIKLTTDVTENELLDKIVQLNQNEKTHGILVQLPLPEHINEQNVIETIHPDKDVDGFHPVNTGKMLTNQPAFLPCTPSGIMKMLDSYNISVKGKHAVIVGRSNIVGKPVGQLLLNRDATVTHCHSKTEQLESYTKNADILIAAVGSPNMIQKDMVKEGSVIIDVGINRLDDGSLTGDVDFSSVEEKVSYITPVPKGVGPMTITMLLDNAIKAAKGLTEIAR